MRKNVYLVFCMDTEGPCDDPGNNELLGTWPRVDAAMDKLFSDDIRFKYPDADGEPFKIGWFFLTWTGFSSNPRGRDMGPHKVRDHFLKRWGKQIHSYADEEGWHYHHPPLSGVGNEWNTDWSTSNHYETIINENIMERQFFPVSYRAGGTIHTVESSNWIDAWFPFDYSSRAPVAVPEVDWSEGCAEWKPYRPCAVDFRRPGNGRRSMVRTLDLVTRAKTLSEADIREAFQLADSDGAAILSVFDHDYRDIADRVVAFLGSVNEIAKEFPDVHLRYRTPRSAVVDYYDRPAEPGKLLIESAVYKGEVAIWTSDPIYQSVPWVVVEFEDGSRAHLVDGVRQTSNSTWRFNLPEQHKVRSYAVAASTSAGQSAVFTRNAPFETAFEIGPIKDRHPKKPNSINDHSAIYPKLCEQRARGSQRMDCIEQAAQILKGLTLESGTVLDVGCAAGQLSRELEPLGFKYTGIDAFQRAVEIGKLILSGDGFEADLRNTSLENFDSTSSYDVVMNLFEFRYAQNFHRPLEQMARLANKYLIIRAPSFGEHYQANYLPDVLLEEDFQTMRANFNIFNKDEVAEFLASEGFSIAFVVDERQQRKFGGEPEVVGGIAFNYQFLVAERVRERPSREMILGDYWHKHAELWSKDGQGIPGLDNP